jgi:hypothetical protein
VLAEATSACKEAKMAADKAKGDAEAAKNETKAAKKDVEQRAKATEKDMPIPMIPKPKIKEMSEGSNRLRNAMGLIDDKAMYLTIQVSSVYSQKCFVSQLP